MMLTKCPACATAFRITPEQLKLRQGRVRCGRCQHVFNALEALVVEEAIPAAAPITARQESIAERAPAPAPVAPPPPKPAATRRAEPAPAPAPVPAPVEDAAASDMDFVYTSVDELDIPIPTARAAEDERIRSELKAFRIDLPPEHEAAPEEALLHEPPPSRSWPWVVGSLFALISLVAQAAFLYRVDLTVLRPDLRPTFISLCEQFGCDVPLPQQIKLIDIEASDLNPDANAKGHLRLTATLKNRASFPQEFPQLELTLTDTLDRPLVRRVFSPTDYLPAKSDQRTGFSANADIGINLPLEVAGASASGYRLYLFYP